ncbi:MAG: DoxX family membrane protein [Desulfobacteraceae bacterium]|nr:MAG: DoxX family membrane protein [Desulfobacteraceae bacterium]
MKNYQRVTFHTIRLILAAVFIYASIDKIINPEGFAKAIFNHQVLPDSLINVTAIVLPWLELFIGGCLLLNVWTPGAALLTAGLMTVFMAVVSFNLARGLDVACGCFSTTDAKGMDMMTFLRDCLFLVLSWGLVAATFKKSSRIIPSQQASIKPAG